MNLTRRTATTVLLLLAILARSRAQAFFNLTAEEVKIDSGVPCFTHEFPLPDNFQDSVYEAVIDYPEYLSINPTDLRRLHLMGRDSLPATPAIEQHVGISRKRGTLYVAFVPLVCHEGRPSKLVSFRLSLKSRPREEGRGASNGAQGTSNGARAVGNEARVASNGARVAGNEARVAGNAIASRYKSSSVLSSGRWAKISVEHTGVAELTATLLHEAGFSNPDKVRVYGYGGAMQPEVLTGDYLTATDDLSEVPTVTVGGRRLFHAVGPVSWQNATTLSRIRNPYSERGYYFLTEGDEAPLTQDSATFVSGFYPSADDYHSLYEVDDYAWFSGGRNLYDNSDFSAGQTRTFQLPAYSPSGQIGVMVSYDGPMQMQLGVNGTAVGTLSATDTPDDYSVALSRFFTFSTDNLQGNNNVTLVLQSGSKVRLDYISICSRQPNGAPQLSSATFEVPRFEGTISNQNHHGDGFADMVIVIPQSKKLLAQANRLKQLHEQLDGLRVVVVPADELYNEFSSGTPDANAYRRYLKMLYDRAQTDADMPRYLLLFGDGAWDNRMLSPDWSNFKPEDFLLCYESENSFSETMCYVSDDYFCMLDDGEGTSLTGSDKSDVAVGRLTARTAQEAKVLVDKVFAYRNNENAGAWQNTLVFMADDGNQNLHMQDAEKVINAVTANHSSYNIKKVYWDAFVRQTTATGNGYPDATTILKQQMSQGALVMNYSGHGAAYCLSHEQVLKLADFKESSAMRLPLWVTASCDIMPFDGQTPNIGETAMQNQKGGAIAFFGTTRTVYSDRNMRINRAFMRNVLTQEDGQMVPIGEAVRRSKNGLITATDADERDVTQNKLQYTLLGDPALRLAAPTLQVRIDSVNGQDATAATLRKIAAGHLVRVKGHVVDQPAFNGIVTLTVRDAEETVVCRQNDSSQTDEPFLFKDRPNTVYSGSDSIRNGQFDITFAVPIDISFADENGQMLAFAVSSNHQDVAHGEFTNFQFNSADDTGSDGVGPSIYCYLNDESFVNGDAVNHTPFFYAQVSDKDGINGAGNGIGHFMELVVDGQTSLTYDLTNYFAYDFGDYRSGTVGYSIPALSAGKHQLVFRAWDVLNNSSTATLDFHVDPRQRPRLASVVCTKNPATTQTSFVITHNREGSEMDVVLEIFDTSGRKLWQHAETGVPTDRTYTIDWDLTTDSGSKLRSGVYLYRLLVSSNGSSEASEAQKIIILYGN